MFYETRGSKGLQALKGNDGMMEWWNIGTMGTGFGMMELWKDGTMGNGLGKKSLAHIVSFYLKFSYKL